MLLYHVSALVEPFVATVANTFRMAVRELDMNSIAAKDSGLAT